MEDTENKTVNIVDRGRHVEMFVDTGGQGT